MKPKLTRQSIAALQRIITGNDVDGDEPLSPYRSGPRLIEFFNELGFSDVYSEDGAQRRWSYTEECLEQINGTEQMAVAIEAAVDPRAYYRSGFDVAYVVKYLNRHLSFDGWILEAVGPRYRLRAHESAMVSEAPLDGTAEERLAWSGIEKTELSLRRVIEEKYKSKWGDAFEREVRKVLGERAWKTLENHREKHIAGYPSSPVGNDGSILDYTYLNDLVLLMTSNEAWEMFETIFDDRRQLEDFIKAIKPVRNDRAHFRRVPLLELRRCQIACEDLRVRLEKSSSV